MKKIISVLLVIVTIFALSSCGNTYNGEYSKLDMETIDKEYKENSVRAEEKYIGAYVETSGELYAINSKTDITVHVPDDSCVSGKRIIICKVKSTEAKEMVKNLSVGDMVTVKGKITKIGGLWDCHINVYEID